MCFSFSLYFEGLTGGDGTQRDLIRWGGFLSEKGKKNEKAAREAAL